MAMPKNQPIIDTMIGFPMGSKKEVYAFITQQLKDTESKEEFTFPAQYMFKDVPDEAHDGEDPIKVTLDQMDKYNIEIGMIGVDGAQGQKAITDHPDRFVGTLSVDPNRGVDALRDMTKAKEMWDIRSIGLFPSGTYPQVAINGKQMYPVYAKACELEVPVFCCAGVPGPRLKMEPQRVEHIDEVMYDFPELVFVTRHGCEPWTELAVKLMLKWPNLYYSTSAFAPRHYNQNIINYANSRGADKVLNAGYYPMGMELSRIMGDMPGVPFNEDVWPKFLYGNAAKILKITK